MSILAARFHFPFFIGFERFRFFQIQKWKLRHTIECNLDFSVMNFYVIIEIFTAEIQMKNKHQQLMYFFVMRNFQFFMGIHYFKMTNSHVYVTLNSKYSAMNPQLKSIWKKIRLKMIHQGQSCEKKCAKYSNFLKI